jgi:hypothetical protein
MATTEVRDPICGRRAADMDDYDSFIAEGPEDLPVKPEQRIDYVLNEEGTYDPASGQFLCDSCYIKVGQPSGPGRLRWTATRANVAQLLLAHDSGSK